VFFVRIVFSVPSALWYCWLGLLTVFQTLLVPMITYTVLVETLNPAQSIDQSTHRCTVWCVHCVVVWPSVTDTSCPARWVVYPNSHSGTYAKHAESATTKRRCLDYCVADDWCIAVEWGNFGNCRVFYKNLRRRSLPSITQFVIDRQCGTASGIHVHDFTICITSVSK